MIDLSIYLVTREGSDIDRMCENIELAVKSGVSCVQLRQKEDNKNLFFKKASKIKDILDKTCTPLIINDNAHIAKDLDTAGLHIGQDDGSVERARNIIGYDKILGLSVDNKEQLLKAQGMEVDYIGVGAVFPTSSKNDVKNIWGREGLLWARKNSRLPIVAIGGINRKILPKMKDSKVSGIAMIAEFFSTYDVSSVTRQVVAKTKELNIINPIKA